MKRFSKNAIVILYICVFIGISIFNVSAEESENTPIPDDYEALESFIPDDIVDVLPDGLFDSDPENVGDAVNALADFEFLLDFIGKTLNIEIESSLRLLVILCGSLMLCSVINGINSDTLSGSGKEVSTFLCNLLVLSVLLSFGNDMLECADVFFARLNFFMSGMLPLMCTLCAMGGGLASAVAANYGISAFITLSEIALSKTITPIVGTCIGLASVGGIGESSAGVSVLNGIKKTYVFLIGMLMTVMLFVFSARGIMAHSADTLGGRAIKFAAGNFIPIVGANIGEILRGVGSGISYVKNTVGVVSVLIIFMMIVPVFISVAVRRMVLSISETIAELLGASQQARLIREFSSIYGMLLAVISMSSVLFIAAVIICVKIGNAVSV